MSGMTHPLARARGHGSAKKGAHHWLVQRASAVLLLFLVPWMVYALICVAGADHAEAALFAARPLNASLLILSLLTVLYHGQLGLQVVIEDYVHRPAVEIGLQFLVRGMTLLAAILGVVHILQLALGA